MTGNRSRTYRLRLSNEGTDLFLSCHYRLAKIAKRFIPYGATLSVAMLLLGAMDIDELAGELAMPSVKRLAGEEEHFVGASAQLTRYAAMILDRLEGSSLIGNRPAIGKLHVAAIAVMAACEDHVLAQAFQKLPFAFGRG